MEILITNDDGISAKGLSVLTQVMCRIGHVTVVAPDGARSGMSNAITSTMPLRLTKIDETPAMRRYVSNGTPTDCVKLAINEIYTDSKPDLLVSGINHGANSAICVIYSGTMGAVLEGCENGILSIGYSLCDHKADADFHYFDSYIEMLTRKILQSDVPYGTCFNINAPQGEIKGVRLARQCKGFWTKEFEKRIDTVGRPYYWMTGYFQNEEPNAPDTDEYALTQGYVSVVPTKIDLTDYQLLADMQQMNNIEE